MATDQFTRIGVIGAGSWGTTLGNLLAEKGLAVDLWVREEEVYEQIKGEGVNKVFLPEKRLAPGLSAVRSYEEALHQKELVLIAVPSHVFRDVLLGMKPYLGPETALMTATKGIENQTLKTMSRIVEEILPEGYRDRFASLGGPSFAKEVAQKYPTAVTIGCRDTAHAQRLQRLFNADFFRVYTTDDLTGVELCGALKNVIAIAAGASDGLCFGHNARAALITRGLVEMARLGNAMGAHPLTFSGLAGMGDLVLTCTGDLSRNRTVGVKLGMGMSLDEITRGMTMVAEGIRTTMSAYELAAKFDVEMPITKQVFDILYRQKDPMEAVRELMGRELKKEPET